MKANILFLQTLMLLGIAACSSTKSSIPTGDNSMNAVDWNGTYYGVIPCADCSGIETVLTLTKDLQYTLKRKYIGKSTDEIVSTGNFKWSKDGSTITLQNSPSTMYKVGENRIFQLDTKGKPITGDLSEKYTLLKQPLGLTEKYWKLVELHGKPVVKTERMRKEPYMILKTENNRVNAHGGCNSFNGTYTLEPNNRIKFSQMAGTLMACNDMETETAFAKVLETADSYNLDGDKLVLNRARMAPLARFEAVYFK